MKSTDIYSLFEAKQELFEVDMSPSNLKKLASAIPGVMVGMEFEMVVPGVHVDDEDDYNTRTEPDYSVNDRPDSIDEIIEFFGYDDDYRGVSNSYRTLDLLRIKLDEMYTEWLNDKFLLDGKDYLTKWIKENVEPSEVAEFARTAPDLFGEIIPSKQDYEDFMEDQWDNEYVYFESAREEFRDDARNDGDLDEEAWLRDAEIDSMSEVEDIQFGRTLEWPRYEEVEPDFDGNETIDSIGEDFSEAIGKPVYTSDSYHGARREPGAYSLEPDSSIDTDGGAGLEFISPPMGVDEMFKDLHTVKKWAKRNSAYTNRSTGLHINVSIPDYSLENLDFVKLAVLLGDQYVLNQFGRLSNTYAKSALEIIKDRRHDTNTVNNLLTQLKSNVGDIASKILHNGNTDKYTSINTKNQYVEFRSAGGDWLDKNFDKIENTTLRFIVALDAACDPEKYKKEYHKALYKTLKPKDSTEDMSKFALYMSGEITRSQYANSLAQERKDRLVSKGIKIISGEQVDEGDWEITYDDGRKSENIYIENNSAVPNEKRAAEAAKQFKPNWFTPDRVKYVTIAPFKFDQMLDELKLYGASYGSVISSVVAKNEEEAIEYIKRMNPERFASYPDTTINIDVENASKRSLLRILDWQEKKLEVGDKWIQKTKIWHVFAPRLRTSEDYYIAATNREEVADIIRLINPEQAADPSLTIIVSEPHPTEGQIRNRAERQNRLIQQREELLQYQNDDQGDDLVPIEVANLEVYRVHNMNGYMYVAAENHREAAEIANHLDPEKFGNIGDLTVNFADSLGNQALISAMYRRQLEQFRNPATRDPSFAAPKSATQITGSFGTPQPAFSEPRSTPATSTTQPKARIGDLHRYEVSRTDASGRVYVTATSEQDAFQQAIRMAPSWNPRQLSARKID
jgi:predicted house-cleaning noncanonical NTP pyrophosphatase (MazG superfamily)